MLLDADRTHARTAAAMRNTEGFVQIDVGHIGTDFGRLGYAYLRIQIGAIHVNLAAMIMYYLADFLYGFLIHTMSRRVGDHQCG